MNRGSLWLCSVAVAAVLALTRTAAVRANGSDSVTVPLEPYVGRLLSLTATIGREKLKLLLDTGGGQTLIGPGVAARLGCTPRGRGVALRMSGERVEFRYCDSVALEIGGRRFHRPEIAVWDVTTLLPPDLPPVDGVLALDTFADQPFTLDLAGRTLTLESSETLQQRIARMRRVEARIATGLSGADLTVFVRGDLDESGWFLLDSGNLDLVQAAPHMIHGGGVDSREASLRLSGLPPVAVSVRGRDIVHDAVLSEAFLRGWVWTFRLATGDVWAARVGADPHGSVSRGGIRFPRRLPGRFAPEPAALQCRLSSGVPAPSPRADTRYWTMSGGSSRSARSSPIRTRAGRPGSAPKVRRRRGRPS